MDPLKAYKIGFTGLSIGNHSFSFEIGADFFDCFEQSEIRECAVHLDLNLEKETNMLVFDFFFGGWVCLECDRCLEKYREAINQEERIYVKFGDNYKEESENVLVIPYGESHFDVSQFVYEFLHLGLPIRRVHPDDEQGVSACSRDMIDKMEKHAPGSNDDQSSEAKKSSTWDALRSIKFNKKDSN